MEKTIMFPTLRKTLLKKQAFLLLLLPVILTACGGGSSARQKEEAAVKEKVITKKEAATKENTNNKYLLFSQKNTNQLMAYNTPENDSKKNPFIKLNIYTQENAANLLNLTTNITAVLSGSLLSFIGFEKENKLVWLNKKIPNVSAIQKNEIAGLTFISVLSNGTTQLYRTSVNKSTKQQEIVDSPYQIKQPEKQILPGMLLEIADEKPLWTAFFTSSGIDIYKGGKSVKQFACPKPTDAVIAHQQFAVKCDGIYHAYALVPRQSDDSKAEIDKSSSPSEEVPSDSDEIIYTHKFSPINIKNVTVTKVVNDGFDGLLGIGKKNAYRYTINYESTSGFLPEKITMKSIGEKTLCDLVVGKGMSKEHRMVLDTSAYVYAFQTYREKNEARFKLSGMKNCNAMQATGAEHAFYVVDNKSRILYHIDTHVGISYHVHNDIDYTNNIDKIHNIAYISFAKEKKDGE